MSWFRRRVEFSQPDLYPPREPFPIVLHGGGLFSLFANALRRLSSLSFGSDNARPKSIDRGATIVNCL